MLETHVGSASAPALILKRRNEQMTGTSRYHQEATGDHPGAADTPGTSRYSFGQLSDGMKLQKSHRHF